MRIAPISNFNYSKNYKNKTVSSPSFTSIERETWQNKKTGQTYKTESTFLDGLNINGLDLVNRNHSYIFRGDFCWNRFQDRIAEHFKDVPKVNVYSFGCSDGSEPYSVISLVQCYKKKDADKFFPIKCYDIDEDVIEIAKRGKLDLLTYCFSNIKEVLGDKSDDYFDFYCNTEGKYGVERYVEVKDSVKEKAEFSVGNFLDELDNVEKKNSIVFCRNFWPYLTKEEREIALEKLSKLEKGSLVCIGNFDSGVYTSFDLEENGFEYFMQNVFVKS